MGRSNQSTCANPLVQSSLTVLGCRIGPGLAPDWDGVVVAFENQPSLWKSRALSFRGRALLANVLGLSLFWYQATVFDVPKVVVTRINKILFRFVWNKPREWLARSSVTQPLADGGLAVIDVSRKILSLRAVWLRRLLTASMQHPWVGVFTHHLASVFPGSDVSALFAQDSIPAYRIKRLPPFYASIIYAWQHLRGEESNQGWVIPRPQSDPLPLDRLNLSFPSQVRLFHIGAALTVFIFQEFPWLGPKECNATSLQEALSNTVPSAETDPLLFVPPTAEEIQLKLRSLANSAPGKDRLEYRHLRVLDPKCEVLAKIFARCFAAKDVPQQWKTATTILIHKKGLTIDPSNFRPIALMSCLYKLLMSPLAKRVTSHAINHELLSPQQKSARPNEGCYEHGYLQLQLYLNTVLFHSRLY